MALSVQAYDMVDTHIRSLDGELKKFEEDLRVRCCTCTMLLAL